MFKERLVAFTDAVIAIILTILVLDIHLPERSHQLINLVPQIPVFIAYMASFLIIAAFWVSHMQLFHEVQYIEMGSIWANILFLFFLSLFPATTAWFGSDIQGMVPALLYGINILLVNGALLGLRSTLQRTNHINREMQRLEWLSLGINGVGCLLIFLWPPVILISLVTDSVLWLISTSRKK
ncbi:TMEM175 family protein [Levilactobacillus bambusae]|uniref:DUF1211 domain-containing protein n=1 Tax=Levilactobacillus bambusae TaxID=2024736 RepID=A0A2V1N016_9LACO|nr:TMEM175 family protein [Levilactobacillus bambusae]PWG00363.1 DUF1211 domain-containing protein [Levilactobacillus bambusae]